MALILICSMAGLLLALIATFILGCFAYSGYVRFQWEKHGEVLPALKDRTLTQDVAYISMLFDDDVTMPAELQRQLLSIRVTSLAAAVMLLVCCIFIFGQG